MRVINTSTLQLQDINPERRGTRYAILSHTWGSEEVLFNDVRNLGEGELAMSVRKEGANKVIGSCIQARKDGYDYIWIDTCCIDKSSSAELTEAINSMFKWYALAGVCYAYLGDLTAAAPVEDMRSLSGPTFGSTEFLASKWFTRGWTLQELIAPHSVIFFDREWVEIGTRNTLSVTIARKTSINEPLLNPRPLKYFRNLQYLRRELGAIPASTPMIWASSRVTTRGEDLAYSLMGLFDVNMPLLYGEGAEKAFIRLQREMITAGTDQSILAFTVDDRTLKTSILAPSPRVRFRAAVKEPLLSPANLGDLSLQGNRFRATVFLGKVHFDMDNSCEIIASYVAVLQFQAAGPGGFLSRPALHLDRLPAENGDLVFRKVGNYTLWIYMAKNGNMRAAKDDEHVAADYIAADYNFSKCIFISTYTSDTSLGLCWLITYLTLRKLRPSPRGIQAHNNHPSRRTRRGFARVYPTLGTFLRPSIVH